MSLANSKLEVLASREFGFGADIYLNEALMTLSSIPALKGNYNIVTRNFILPGEKADDLLLI